jgi:hypothetical protein
MRRFITWLYFHFVFMPQLREKMKQDTEMLTSNPRFLLAQAIRERNLYSNGELH